MNTTHTVNDTQSTSAQIAAMHATAEARARAMQAAYVGEVVSAAIGRIGKAVAGLVRAWRDWSERQQSLAYLERLDERLLADIGLSHATLQEALRRPAHKLVADVVPPVESVIAENATPAAAANQDLAQDRNRDRTGRRHAA